MFGKSLSQYLRFQGWVLALLVLAFFVRLFLQAPWVSLTWLETIGLIYYALAVPLSGFGSYRHLLVLLIIQAAVTQWLIAAAIAAGILTGHDNMYTQPEYFGGADGKTWFHFFLHAVVVVVLGPLVSMIFAAPIMFVTKKLKRV